MNFSKVNYKDLNNRQKENYNFHKVAAKLAEYGFNSVRLSDDFKGADFIAIHSDGEQFLKVQLKGRFTVDKKYLGKSIYIAFIESNEVKLYNHDKAVSVLTPNVINSKSWKTQGSYSFNQTPKHYSSIIQVL